MSSLISPHLNTFTLLFSLCFLLLLLLSAASSLRQQQPPNSLDQGSSLEDKTRLGSTPPSCHNKCNGCHPCMAVQVPPTVLPGHHDQVQQLGLSKASITTNSVQYFDSSSGNQYSNYKPLGWKCRCGDHFYNP